MCRYVRVEDRLTSSQAHEDPQICRAAAFVLSVVCRTENLVRGSPLGNLAVFVLVLVVLKFFFGRGISIIGSVVLTIILSLVFVRLNRR